MIGQNNTQKENRHYANNDYWYRQRIIDKIHEMHSQNNTENLWLPKVMDNLNFDLVKSTIILFGSWENALKNAGIYNSGTNTPSSLGKDHWSDEKIIEQIRALHSFRFDLSAKFIKIIYSELYYAAKNRSAYGSWCNALSEADVDLRSIRAVATNFWTFSKIYSALHDYDLAYGNVQSSFVRKLNPSLYSASRKYFKSWSETITMAGLKPDRAFLKILLEPLRNHILLEYVKKVFELLGIKHKIHMSSESDYTATGNIDDMPELYELRETIRLPTYHIESTEFEDGAFVIPSYRSWGFMANAGDMFIETLTRHPRIVVFYSIGEPRRWIDDKLKFININQFYPELVSRGMDDVINAIGTLARGGIPKEYNDLFNAYMKDIKKIIKRKKKK